MKSAPVRQPGGYTIVETMIFLVISAALVVAAVGIFSTRIQHTQFSQTVQELATRLRTTVNEVSTGTYPESNFDCKNDGVGVPSVSTGGGKQGGRTDCIFVGKVVNFGVEGGSCSGTVVGSTCSTIETYTAVGRRELNTTTHALVTELFGAQGANSRLVVGAPGDPNLTESFKLGYGTRITGLYVKQPAGNPLKQVAALGLFQGFGGTYNSGNLESGAQNVSFWGLKHPSDADIAPPTPPHTDADIAYALENQPATLNGPNPADGVLVCLRSGNGDQKASITIGTASGALSVDVTMEDSQCP